MNQQVDAVIDYLQYFQIFEPYVLDVFRDLLKDEEFKQCLLQIIALKTNSAMKALLSFKQDKERLNLQGLFNAELMTGSRVRKIAEETIEKLLETLSHDKLESLGYPDKTIEQISQSLTMKQLYELTEVEFTCTSVDLNNQVVRFFNHKTSPDLPACMAVKMSGSFPVAFKAHLWEKEWGKYFIHYENIRREVDLTGCKFTDGGFLVNFPLQNLDNEEMRPMYFSHQKTEKTLLWGFGIKSFKPSQETEELERINKEIGSIS